MTLVAHCVHHTDTGLPFYFRVPEIETRVVEGGLVTSGGRTYHVVEITEESEDTGPPSDLHIGTAWPYCQATGATREGRTTRRMCPECKRLVSLLHIRHGSSTCFGEADETCYAHGCGLPTHATCYERRSYRRYCAVHYAESNRRALRERQEGIDRAQERRGHAIVHDITNMERRVPTQYSLLNDALRPPPSSDRVLMNVHPDVRERLRALLVTAPEMRGVGYSAFINRAIEVAYEQIEQQTRDQVNAVPDHVAETVMIGGYDEFQDSNGQMHHVPHTSAIYAEHPEWDYMGRMTADGEYEPA